MGEKCEKQQHEAKIKYSQKVSEESNNKFDEYASRAKEGLAEERLNLAQNMSSELEKAENRVAFLKDTTNNISTLIKSTQGELESANQNLDNMYKKLSKNNPSSSKCASVTATVCGATGTVSGGIMIGSTSIAAIVAFGGTIVILSVGVTCYGLYRLFKEPNPAVKDIDVEQAVQNNLHDNEIINFTQEIGQKR